MQGVLIVRFSSCPGRYYILPPKGNRNVVSKILSQTAQSQKWQLWRRKIIFSIFIEVKTFSVKEK
jgi:hypothetical protein